MQFLEQGALYNSWNFALDANNSQANDTARITLLNVYNCPSDASTGTLNNNSISGGISSPEGRTNYFASIGGTAGQQYANGGTLNETNPVFVGIFNVTYDSSQSQFLDAAKTQPNPLFQAVKGTTLAAITDGTSNTAMYAEIKRSRFPFPAPAADPTNYIDQMNLIGSFTNLQTPDVACNTLEPDHLSRKRILPLQWSDHELLPHRSPELHELRLRR